MKKKKVVKKVAAPSTKAIKSKKPKKKGK